jgi:hypothetical protein
MSQREAAERLVLHSDESLPGLDSVLRSWKRWERGQAKPSPVYQRAIARMFESVPAAYFGDETERRQPMLLSEDATVDLVSRLRASKIDDATIEAMALHVDGLCSAYGSEDRDRLRADAQEWLARLGDTLASQLSYAQHRQVLELAGWLTLLTSCLCWDGSDASGAEQARRSAIALGTDIAHPDILGWAAEIRAWMALTTGNLTGVVTAAREGLSATTERPVAVQLYAQEAKAWARMGDKTRAHLALNQARELLAALPVPANPRNHFEVDPVKVDFYAMDVWRLLGEDALAALAAETIRRTSTSPGGKPLSPMRLAEAQITDATILARNGDLGGALSLAEDALSGDRRSLPSLLMVGSEFAGELSRVDPDSGVAADYRAHLADLAASDEP